MSDDDVTTPPPLSTFDGVSEDELTVVLQILQNVQLESAEAKILAGQFQLRVREALNG